MDLNEIKVKALNGEELSKKQCLSILALEDISELLTVTLEVREKFKGRTVQLQVLTNMKSGHCSENCHYCSQSCVSSATIDAYALVAKEKLMADAKIAKEKNVKRHCLGISSITHSDQQIDKFIEVIKDLKKESNLPICLSIGFLTEEQAIKLKQAGVSRINHNLNTSRRNYPNICSTHTYQQRIDNLLQLKKVGLEICCGGIIGVGENDEDVVDMLFDLKTIDPQSVPINFLIPIAGTPFGNMDVSHLTPEYCLKVLCLARLLLPQKDIRAAAGREIYLKGYEHLMFNAVNSVFAAGYLTEGGQSLESTIKLIESAGFVCEME